MPKTKKSVSVRPYTLACWQADKLKMRPRVVIMGIPGDPHAVGARLMQLLFSKKACEVFFKRPTTMTELFGELERIQPHVVVLSSANGHALGVLEANDFSARINHFRHTCGYKPIMCIGGNLTIGPNVRQVKKSFLDMGFDYVDPRAAGVSSLTAFSHFLNARLLAETPTPASQLTRIVPSKHRKTSSSLSRQQSAKEKIHPDERLADFFQRQQGSVPCFDEIVAAFTNKTCYMSDVMQKAKAEHKILVQPRAGVASIQGQIDLLAALSQAGADCLPLTIDSYTRRLLFAELDRQMQIDPQGVNGFPAIWHGVDGCKRVIEAFPDKPIQIRHGSPDPRLLAAVTLGAGCTAFEGGGISYNIPYCEKTSILQALSDWQFVDRLCGLLAERQIIIDRESFGPLTANLIPPSLALVVSILEAILAAQTGVKSISLGYAEQGNRWQDIAAMRSIEPLADKYLAIYGFKDIVLSTVYHQYMAAFPTSAEKIKKLLYGSAITGALAGAHRIITKSPAEAVHIPTASANAQGIRLVRKAIAAVTEYEINEERIAEEMGMIRAEVDAILASILHLSADVMTAISLAFAKGLLDIPFAPHQETRGKVITVRDSEGAIRYAKTGNMVLPAQIKKFHSRQVNKRLRAFATDDISNLVVYDSLFIAENQFEQWPLNPS
jgi:methylaspartate mutase epsilon subunit